MISVDLKEDECEYEPEIIKIIEDWNKHRGKE